MRSKALSPMMNVIFGMFATEVQSITDSPIGLGRLPHSWKNMKVSVLQHDNQTEFPTEEIF